MSHRILRCNVQSLAHRVGCSLVLLPLLLSAACAAQPTAAPTRGPQPTRARLPTATPTITPIPYTGEEIISRGMENMKAVTTMKYMMNNSMTGGGIGVTGNVKGRYQTPDQHFIQLNLGGNAIEILSLSPEAYFMRTPETPEWVPFSQAKVKQVYTLFTIMNPFDLLKLDGLALNLQKLDNVQIDGVDCYHLQFDMDMDKYIEMMGKSDLGPVDLSQASAVGQIWVGSKDLLFRQTQFDFVAHETGGDVGVKEKWVYYDFNQPVEILEP